MTIDPSILRPRVPRLGTVTTGYGQEATSRAGNAYSRPTRSDTLVFHTNDREVAEMVAATLGGRISEDSPTWEFDVITARREVEVRVLVAGFRQALESWRAAQCARRCDGVTMSLLDGRPVSGQPCLCNEEMADGQERECAPHTTLPVLVDLDVPRLGVWEVKSTSWGTASAIAGTLNTLAMMGVTAPMVPAVLSMVDRTLRDASNQVREVTDLHLTIAAGFDQLEALGSVTQRGLPVGPAELEAPEDEPAPEPLSEDDARRSELGERLALLRREVARLEMRQAVASDWEQMFPGRERPSDLTVDELAEWVRLVEAHVADAAHPPADSGPEAAQPPLPDEPATASA
jgi:hypothetical protein